MAKKEETNQSLIPKFPADNDVLKKYQNTLYKDLNKLKSCFSLFLIAFGLYLLVKGLYGMINTGDDQIIMDPNSDNVSISTSIVENLSDDQSKKILNGNIGEGGLFTERVKAASSSAEEKAFYTAKRIASEKKWSATDYVKGDIGIGAYTIKLGDTLWEIADAVYGDGFQWKKILADNKELVGFLPDGSQALIFPGQIFKINR